MRRVVFLSVAMILTLGCFVFAADPAEGYWISVDDKTQARTAGWQVYIDRDGKLYGKIVSAPGVYPNTRATYCKESYRGFPVAGNVKQMAVLNTPWLFGLQQVKNKPGEWEKGNIIDPNDGNMYTGTIKFHPAGSRVGGQVRNVDTLEMRGSIGPFGRSQYWQKANQQQASNVR